MSNETDVVSMRDSTTHLSSTTSATITDNTSSAQTTHSGLITDLMYHYILMGFSPLWLVICSCGIFTNILNIVTFKRMDLQDSVTISFFFLSIADLASLVVAFVHTMTVVLRIVQRELSIEFKLDPKAVAFLCAHYRPMPYDISVLTTTFLALQRGCCVAMPLHFKSVFTPSRTGLILICIGAFSLLCHLPVFATHGITRVNDLEKNTTRYVLWVSDAWQNVQPVSETISSIFLPPVTQTVIIISLIVIVVCLKKSSRFRQASSTVSVEDVENSGDNVGKEFKPKSIYMDKQTGNVSFHESAEHTNGKVHQTEAITACKRNLQNIDKDTELNLKPKIKNVAFTYDQNKNASSQSADHGVSPSSPDQKSDNTSSFPKRRTPLSLTPKDMQVIKAVSLVGFIFIVTNTPRVVVTNLTLYLPGFENSNENFLASSIRFTAELVNSAVNFFIYYEYNAKFRKFLPFVNVD